jgi:hypothetical protein
VIMWLRTRLARDAFPFSCDEVGVRWRPRSTVHVYINYTSSREDKAAPWAYGTLGVHTRQDEGEEDLVPALSRAVSAVMLKASRADIRMTDPVLYCGSTEPDEARHAAEVVAARLGWPHTTRPRRY